MAGWRALARVLQISKQIRQQQRQQGGQGGAGGFLSTLGQFVGFGGINTTAPTTAPSGGAQGASGGTVIINNTTNLPVADLSGDVQRQLVEFADLNHAAQTDYALRTIDRGAV